MNVPNVVNCASSAVDPASGLVCADINCCRCGYNLRTLLETGRCPECGAPVGVSTRGNFLQYADPDWVSQVAKGLSIVFAMIIASIAINAGGMTAVAIPGGLHAVIGAIITGAEIYGVWLMTEPDPSGIGEEKNMSARKLVRGLSVVAAGTALSQLLAYAVSGRLSAPADKVLAVVVVVSTLAKCVAFLVRFSYFAIIARRIPHKKIVDRSVMLRKATIFCFLLTVIGSISLGVSSIVLPTSTIAAVCNTITFTASLPAGIGYLIISVWTILIVAQLQKAVAAEARRARRNLTWSTHVARGQTLLRPIHEDPISDRR